MNVDDDIAPSDVELTEQELNKIFFSPGEIKSVLPGVKKLEKKKRKQEEIIVNVPIKKPEVEPEQPQKRPQGRPKKWTKEKIAELKLAAKKDAAERKRIKEESSDISKLSLMSPISDYERTKLIRKQLDANKKIETELVEQKNENRTILNQKENIHLWNKPKCKRHNYKIMYFEANNVVATCDACSSQITMTISDWRRYMQTNRRL